MATPKPIRVSLKLTQKRDGDLITLANAYSFNQLIIFAGQKYLGKTQESISIPPSNLPKDRWINVIIHKEDDADVYNLIRRMPSGSRAHAIKLIIRHAMESCDLSFILDDLPAKEGSSKKSETPKEGVSAARSPISQSKPRKETEAPERKSSHDTVPVSTEEVIPPVRTIISDDSSDEQDDVFKFI